MFVGGCGDLWRGRWARALALARGSEEVKSGACDLSVGRGGRGVGGSGWCWRWCGVGADCLWFDRRFLRLRTGLRRIRWVAQFRRGPDVALAAGGCVRRLKVKPMVKSRRLRRALCNGGRGGVRRSGGGSSVGRLCPGSLVAVVARREPARPGGVQPDHTCWPAETLGLTPPARPAWLRPPTATRDPGHHPCGVNRVHFATHTRR